MTSQLEIENIDVRYDDNQVLDRISYSLEPGTIGCILGPSGCGKTTTLRCIAGLEKPEEGDIVIDSQQL